MQNIANLFGNDRWTVFWTAVGAIGTCAVPIIVAKLGNAYLRAQGEHEDRLARAQAEHEARLAQRVNIHEATLAEKISHYNKICPLINRIFSYRTRVGNFLSKSPESILKAKRAADHEFWAFHYIWSEAFKESYRELMADSFAIFNKEGFLALINANATFYTIQPGPSTTNGDMNKTPWDGFSGQPVDKTRARSLYSKLMASVSDDIGLTPIKNA